MKEFPTIIQRKSDTEASGCQCSTANQWATVSASQHFSPRVTHMHADILNMELYFIRQHTAVTAQIAARQHLGACRMFVCDLIRGCTPVTVTAHQGITV